MRPTPAGVEAARALCMVSTPAIQASQPSSPRALVHSQQAALKRAQDAAAELELSCDPSTTQLEAAEYAIVETFCGEIVRKGGVGLKCTLHSKVSIFYTLGSTQSPSVLRVVSGNEPKRTLTDASDAT